MKHNRFSLTNFGTLLALATLLLFGRTLASAASPVMHEEGSYWYWCPLPEGYSLVADYEANPGDIVRENQDGTLWLHIAANPITVHIIDPDGNVVYEGVGHFETWETAVLYEDGSIFWDGRALQLSLKAYLDDQSTPEVESVRFVLSGLLHDLAWDQGRLQFAPLSWDIRLHDEPYTWF